MNESYGERRSQHRPSHAERPARGRVDALTGHVPAGVFSRERPFLSSQLDNTCVSKWLG